MLLRRLRTALDLDSTALKSQAATPSRFALLRRVRSAVDLAPAKPRGAAARTLALLGPLALVAALAPPMGQQAGMAPWMILSVQELAIAGMLGLVVAMVRQSRAR